MKTEVYYYKSDMQVRPTRFSILWTPSDSSDKTQLICYTILLCLFAPNTILIEAGWTTLPSPATNVSILTCKSSAKTKQSVISVALKTPLEIRLGICIYKSSLLHRPNDYTGFTPSCPPTFYKKLRPCTPPLRLRDHLWFTTKLLD